MTEIGTHEKTGAEGLSASAERRLSRIFLVFPAACVAVLFALAATFSGGIEARMAERFLSEKAVPVFRAELALLALLALAPWLARRSLSDLLRPAVMRYSRFHPSEAPRVAATPSADKALAWLAAALALGFVACGLAFPKAYRVLITEDGPLESGSALCWLAGAAAVAAAFAWRREASPFSRMVYGFFFLFFFVCGGEEMSWGQRLIGFQGPEALLEVNKQHETNLHNIGSISLFANGIFVFSSIFFHAVPRFLRRDPKLEAYLRHLGLPHISPIATRVFTIALAAWFIIGIRYGTLGFHPYSVWGHYTQMDDELFEFFMAFAFMTYALLDAAEACKSRK